MTIGELQEQLSRYSEDLEIAMWDDEGRPAGFYKKLTLISIDTDQYDESTEAFIWNENTAGSFAGKYFLAIEHG